VAFQSPERHSHFSANFVATHSNRRGQAPAKSLCGGSSLKIGEVKAERVIAPRSRWGLLGFAAAVLVLGWSARTFASSLPFLMGTYAPDTLWALLVFLVVLLLRPALPTLHAFSIALLVSYGVEFSQLYQAPWLNQIRDTRLGGLLLGHGFLWSDLVCYTVGIALGAAIDARFRKPTTAG
jgi:hypothetical protein